MTRSLLSKLCGITGLLALTCTAPNGWAAEYSTGNALGFSRDGNHFVFEEFGSTDGLGAPYVNLYAIDIVRDRWLKGTPVRLQSSEEEVFALEQKLAGEGITDPLDMEDRTRDAIFALRAKAAKKAKPVISGLGRLRSGDLRVHNPPQELTNDARQVRFSIQYYRSLINSAPDIKAWKLSLRENKFAANDACFGLHDNMAGFRLVLSNEETGEEMVLNDDKRVPKSRGCPLKYYVEQVMTYPRKDGGFSLAVLVRYATPGFEGPDGRLIAVTSIIDP
ncbi:MAG: DUF2259 domain-containing protein [Rhizobiaceae bacterium]